MSLPRHEFILNSTHYTMSSESGSFAEPEPIPRQKCCSGCWWDASNGMCMYNVTGLPGYDRRTSFFCCGCSTQNTGIFKSYIDIRCVEGHTQQSSRVGLLLAAVWIHCNGRRFRHQRRTSNQQYCDIFAWVAPCFAYDLFYKWMEYIYICVWVAPCLRAHLTHTLRNRFKMARQQPTFVDDSRRTRGSIPAVEYLLYRDIDPYPSWRRVAF